MVTLVALGGLLERKPWAFSLEALRLCLLIVVAALARGRGMLPLTSTALSVAVVAALLASLMRYRGLFARGRQLQAAAKYR